MKGLENAYSEDDAEYTLDMIRRPNPYYTIPSVIFDDWNWIVTINFMDEI